MDREKNIKSSMDITIKLVIVFDEKKGGKEVRPYGIKQTV